MSPAILMALGRLWALFTAFFRRSKAREVRKGSYLLPLVLQTKLRNGRSQSPSETRGSETLQEKGIALGLRRVATNSSDSWKSEKERFLRHPSLRKKPQNVPTISITAPTRPCHFVSADKEFTVEKAQISKPRKDHHTGSDVAPTFTVQDYSNPLAMALALTLPDPNSRPPPRPRRPPSAGIADLSASADDMPHPPAVVVTPCTPGGKFVDDSEWTRKPMGSPSPASKLTTTLDALAMSSPLDSLSQTCVRGRLHLVQQQQQLVPEAFVNATNDPTSDMRPRAPYSRTQMEVDTKLNPVVFPPNSRPAHPLERDIADLQVDTFELPNPFDDPVDQHHLAKTPMPTAIRSSFDSVITHGLKKVGSGPTNLGASVLSAFSDGPWNCDPSTLDQDASHATYTTSTPITKQRTVCHTDLGYLNLSSILDVYPFETHAQLPSVAHSETNIRPTEHKDQLASVQSNLPQPTDDGLDLLPYPDVFDLDIYYGVSSNRSSTCSSQSKRESADPFLSTEHLNPPMVTLKSNSDSDPSIYGQHGLAASVDTRSSRRFGFVPESPKTIGVSVDYEVKRFRDHYRHPAYSTPPAAAAAGANSNLALGVPQALSLLPRAPAIGNGLLKTPPARAPLRNQNLNVGITRAATSPSLVPKFKIANPTPKRTNTATYKPPAAPARYPLPTVIKPLAPMVVVSHHRFSSLSEDSSRSGWGANSCRDSPEQDSSLAVLQARLKETCENFPNSVWIDNSLVDGSQFSSLR